MKCPLFILNDRRAQLGEETEIGDCIKSDCAIYSETGEACSVLERVKIDMAIGEVLGRILDRFSRPVYTFRCHYCGLSVSTVLEDPGDSPPGWIRRNQGDEFFLWSCDRCLALGADEGDLQ